MCGLFETLLWVMFGGDRKRRQPTTTTTHTHTQNGLGEDGECAESQPRPVQLSTRGPITPYSVRPGSKPPQLGERPFLGGSDTKTAGWEQPRRHSTGNSKQSSVITSLDKYEKEQKYMRHRVRRYEAEKAAATAAGGPSTRPALREDTFSPPVFPRPNHHKKRFVIPPHPRRPTHSV